MPGKMGDYDEGKKEKQKPINTKAEIISASMIGTILEWYGIFIFSSGALYIAHAFYPTVSTAVSIALTLLTFALGFVMRPVGAFVFGHYGDRIGRKNMLLITLLISGISTGLTGLIPSYASIGLGAVALLITFRLILGFGLGGEWGGALLLTLENLKEKRGFWSSTVQSTVGIGLLLGTASFLGLQFLIPSSAMYAYGWRIPFILSFLILVIGFIIRYRLTETPIFEAAKAEKRIASVPAKQLFKYNWKEVLAGTLLAGSSGNFFYFGITLLPVLFESTKVITITWGLIGVTLFAIFDIVFVYIGGLLSDRYGRRPLLFAGNLIALIFLYPALYFISAPLFLMYLILLGTAHGLTYSPLAAFISESFPTNVRYSGSSMAYQFGNAFIAGPAPYVCTLLRSISYVLTPLYTLIFILIAFGTIYSIKETKSTTLEIISAAPMEK